MSELTWIQEQVITHKRAYVVGHLVQFPREQMHGHLNTVMVIDRPHGGYLFLVLAYFRYEDVEYPKLMITALRADTVEEMITSWKSQFASSHWNIDDHDAVNVMFGIGGPKVKLGDPWLIYHLGAFTEMLRNSEELAAYGRYAVKAAVERMEALTTARITQLTKVNGRK